MLAKKDKHSLLNHWQLSFILHCSSGQQLRHNVVIPLIHMKIFIVAFIILISQNITLQNLNNKISSDTKVEKFMWIQEDSKDIVGTWEINEFWIDYGYKIKQINFSSLGKISFNPSLEIENSETFIGNYEATSDSIKIKFYKKSIFEFYKYKIVNDSLFLMKIDTYAPDEYMLNNYPEENVWKRVYN